MRIIPLEQPLADLQLRREELLEELSQLHDGGDGDETAAAERVTRIEAEVARLQAEHDQLQEDIFASLTPFDKVQLARHPDRPYTLDYLSLLLSDFCELHGDRRFGDDGAVVAGLGVFEGRPVGIAGHQKGRNLAERKARNFGQAGPPGYRKAMRVMELTARFGHPVLTFVDTAGADARPQAEELGISEALAASQLCLATLPVPTVAAVIGEGGSGGAIALALADHIIMLEHSYYSVITPEGCASIIWRDASRHAEAAEALKLSAQDALEFGFCDTVVPEPRGGAHKDPGAAAEGLGKALAKALDELTALPRDELLERRHERFRNMGRFAEEA